MNLSVRIMSKIDTIASILDFQTDDTSAYWRAALFKAYPFLNEKKCLNMTWDERKEYLTTELSKLYDKLEINLQEKCAISQKIWNEKKEQINQIYTGVFGIDCNNLFNNMIAEISLNPICPRNLRHQSFSIVWAGDEFNFLETALHEMIHFVWFHMWHSYFKDNWSEYESPNLKWILSEMVIDTFVKNTDIGNMYPEKYHNNSAYKYFYDMKINHKLILEDLTSLYMESKNIIQFMEKSYLYCQTNEKDIRHQML